MQEKTMTQSAPSDPSTPPVQPAHALPHDVVALIPMRNLAMFPHVLTAVSVGRDKSIAALKHALDGSTHVGIVLQKDPGDDDPAFDTLCAVGTLATGVRHFEP
jgi:ATP-dependent Lon protease